jgi:methyl-accepting chemotaxis protein
VGVAERSGETLKLLVPGIRKTVELVQEVATASREQSTGVTQVNRAMSEVDQVTQRNAAAAEELSATAEQMAEQAESLQQLMRMFKVPDKRNAERNKSGISKGVAPERLEPNLMHSPASVHHRRAKERRFDAPVSIQKET